MRARQLFIITALLCLLLAASPGVSSAGGEARLTVVLGDGTLVPIYTVTGGGSVTSVGFVLSEAADTLKAYDQNGTQLWSVSTAGATLNGGFDFNSDGWPDVSVQITGAYVGNCGSGSSDPRYERTLYFFSGQTGQLYTPVAFLADACFPAFPSGSRVVQQWTYFTPLFGQGTNQLFLSPQYADTGWYFGFSGGQFTADGALYYPSIPSYDSTYVNAQTNAYGTTKYVAFSHVANGLIAPVNGQNRLIFWTSARVVQYSITPLSSTQLVADKPYLTNNDTSLAGRNYGLVSVDPNNPILFTVIAGTSTYAVWKDLRNGTLGSDGCGGIERHISLYNASANTVADRFYIKAPTTCASSPPDSANYNEYVVFPRNPWVKRGPGLSSRLAYNVYSVGRWRLHVTEPGSLTDRYALIDAFLWDITDIDGDGLEEWVISPTKDPGEPDVPGYYFPKRRTSLQRWNEANLTLTAFRTYEGYVPWLHPAFKERTHSNTSFFQGLYPTMYSLPFGQRKVLMMNTSNQMVQITP